MKKALKTTAWVLLGLFVLYTFYFLWKQAQPVPDVYETVKPEVRTLVRSTVATGNIDPRRRVNIKPQTTGIITELLVQPGDMVRDGQVVARIKVIPDMDKLDQVKSHIESAKIELDKVERESERTRQLYNKGVVSREEYEASESKLAVAKENLLSAESQLEVVTTGSSERSGNINTTVVKSTMDGMVMSVPVKEGASVSGTSMFSDGTTICSVADMEDVQFKGNIDETEVDLLRVGMPLVLIPGAMQNVRIPAVLEYVAPEGVEQNGAMQFEIKASTEIPEGVTLRSGYSVNAEIVLEEVHDVLSVDETCIEFEKDKAYAWRLTSDVKDTKHQTWERIPVEVGVSDGLYIQILSGIDEDCLLKGNKVN